MKKLLAITLSLLMMVGMFAGCGAKDTAPVPAGGERVQSAGLLHLRLQPDGLPDVLVLLSLLHPWNAEPAENQYGEIKKLPLRGINSQ